MKKVFLDGTNNSKWREEIIPLLKINYFDPTNNKDVLSYYEIEKKEKDESDYWLYVITPKITGFYSIAKLSDEVNKYPEKIVFCILLTDGELVFGKFQIKSLNAIGKLVVENGGKWFKTLEKTAEYLNNN